MPQNDDETTARKYPYNACELLCCEYVFNIKKYLEKDKVDSGNDGEEKEVDDDEDDTNNKNEQTEKDEFNSLTDDIPLPVVPPQNEEEIPQPQPQPQQEDIPLPQQKPKTQLEKLYSIYDHLFSFLNTSSPTDINNYVLMGYFCKIVTSFLNAKPDIMLKYIFTERPNTMQNLLTHISRKAIGTIIENIVNSINEQENVITEHNDYLLTIATSLINTIKNEEASALDNEIACNTLINCFVIAKKSNFIFLFKHEIFTTLHNTLKHYLSVNNVIKLQAILKVYININEIIIKDFPNKETPSFNFKESENEITNLIRSMSRNNNNISSYDKNESNIYDNIISYNYEYVIEYITAIIKEVISNVITSSTTTTNNENTFDNTFDQSKPTVPLGMKTLVEWEYLRTVFDLIVNSIAIKENEEQLNDIIQVISSEQLAKTLLNTYLTYTTNNMFQNIFHQIISIIICEYTPVQLVNAVLLVGNDDNKSELIESLINNLRNKNSFAFEPSTTTSTHVMNSLTFANDIDVLKMIFNSKHKRIEEILLNKDDIIFFKEQFITDIHTQFNKKLLLSDNQDDDSQMACAGMDDVQCSIETLREIIEYKLKIYNAYSNKEDYQPLIDKHEELLRKREQEQDEDIEDIEEEQFQGETNEVSESPMPLPVVPASYLISENNNNNTNEDNNNNNIEKEEYYDSNYWKPTITEIDIDIDMELE